MIEKKTMSVPEAGRVYFNVGKNAAYEAAKRGEIPTIKIGGLLRVPIVQMERILNGDPLTSEPRPGSQKAKAA